MEKLKKTQKTFMPGTSLLRCLTLSLLSALMYSAGYFFPVPGLVALIFSPTPLALLGMRENTERMIVGLSISVFVLFLLLGQWLALYFLVGEGLLAFGLTLPAKRVRKGSEALLLCTVVSILSKMIAMGLVVALTGENPFIPKPDALQSVMLQIYSGMLGQGPLDAETLRQSMEQVVALAPYMLPSLLILSAMFDSFLNYRLCETLQRKQQTVFPPLPPFTKWRFPGSILWALLAAFILPLVVEENAGAVWIMLEINLKFLINVLFFIQGLSLVCWWLARRGVHFLLRLLIAVLLLLPFLGMWVIALGVGDICIGLRQRKPKT